MNKVKNNFGISVVIPAFNRVDLLSRAYDSVFSISPERVEIIIVDDGSDINILDAIPDFNKNGILIRKYRKYKNSGAQGARNMGIRRARFSYIAFLDSDDAFFQSKIDIILNFLKKESCDLIFHGVEGASKYSVLGNFWYSKLQRIIPLHWLICIFNPVVTPSLIIKRVNKLGVEKFRFSEDWAFLIRYVTSQTRVFYLNEDLSIVFRSQGEDGGLSRNVWKMRQGEFEARRLLFREFSLPMAIIKFGLGGFFGSLRVINDLIKRRYRA